MTKELIAKLEALEAPEKDIFIEVWKATGPHDFTISSLAHKLASKAWESAAIMLVPEGWEYTMDQRHQEAILARSNCYGREEWHEKAEHKHPAIALLICILKAKEPVE